MVTQQIQGRLRVGRLEARWLGRYRELLGFQISTGRLPRESGKRVYGSDEVRLAGWLRYQRRRGKRAIMPAWQRALLEAIPGFMWAPSADCWQRQYVVLREFLEAEGRVPRYRSSEPGERTAAAWVSKQRYLYRRGLLSPERVALLRRLPFRIV